MADSLTQARLKEVFFYDPDTGLFTRRLATSNFVKVGDVCACKNSQGYVVFRVDGKLYRANRLAWLYMTGEWPKHQVDHMNGDRADDRWANLRDVDNQKNHENFRKANANNKAGFLGVSPTQGGAFVACIMSERRKYHLGTFKDPAVAHEAYLTAKRRMHAGCTI